MEKTREMSISAQILQKRKELEELEYQAKMEKANDTIDAVVKAIASRDHVREALSNFSQEEGRIIGQRMAGFIDMFTDLSMDDIAKYREKKAEREAKRKARYATKKAAKDGENHSENYEAGQDKTDEPKPIQPVSNPVAKKEQTLSEPIAEISAQDVQQSAQQSTQIVQQKNCFNRSPSESQLPLC